MPAFTADDLNEWHRARSAAGRNVVPKFVCADGYEVSIQASGGHYCAPRQDRAWPYHRFELGYPTTLDDEIASYAEDKDTRSTVFAFVPVENVLLVINKHGGPKE
jgi:hypothetical protein